MKMKEKKLNGVIDIGGEGLDEEYINALKKKLAKVFRNWEINITDGIEIFVIGHNTSKVIAKIESIMCTL